ncbi:MAG: acyl carrier protein [Gammaproteobacteria bacterium]|nr:acyl carrier protein [Gammaproteobacteria bacterium]
MNDEIKQVMAEVFALQTTDIADDIKMGSIIKWDSLNHLNLVITLQEKYNISFEPEEMSEMTSIAKIAQIILTKQK